jgi:hypothetical protein
MLDSMRRRIAALRLDLSGLRVLTEAATGAYSCTAVIAALAGAERVDVFARDTARHGSAADALAATLSLAGKAGVEARISPAARLDREILGGCDIVTNSGHLRPITREMIASLPAGAVIALMFEAWEFRPADLDLAACRARGVRVAAVNERHPDVAVFPFLGPLCVRQLEDAGARVAGSRVAVLCDNPFAPFLQAGLEQAGASVAMFGHAGAMHAEEWDAVVFALRPGRPFADDTVLAGLAAAAPHVLIAQFWGDIDRRIVSRRRLSIWPLHEPAPGHMGILLDTLGHEPIVRLQAGGLKAAELLLRGAPPSPDGIAQAL